MSLVTIASASAAANVIAGDIMRPLVGVWTADLQIDQVNGQGFGAGTKVTISSENGYSLTGVIDPNRTGSFLDAVHVRVLGGAGGMGKNANPRSFVQPGAFVRDVVNGLVADGGETLSTTTDQGWLSTNLAAWSVLGQNTIARNLRLLINLTQSSFNWRILADGTLWVGAETWPALSGTFDVITVDPKDGSYHLGSEAPFISPGMSVSGVGNVNRVNDKIADGQMNSRVWVDLPGEGNRGTAPAIADMAKQALNGVDYYATYLCQVVSQSADLATVDIQPVGARNKALIGGLQRVPVRIGAGIKIQFNPGATVLLAWDGGNPAGPYVCGSLTSDSAIQIQIAGTTVKINNGAQGAARVNDPISSATAGPYAVSPQVVLSGSTTVLIG